MSTLLVISPHLDDAAFCCGAFMAARPGARAVTVFAGLPPAADVCTAWDAACGFPSARAALAARRAEDAAALAELDAAPVWLDFCDDQYGVAVDVHAIVAALEAELDRYPPGTALFPLGIFHRDHERAHAAGLALTARRPDWTWLMYEDAIYRRHAALREARLRTLAGLALTAHQPPCDAAAHARKARAVACYASQLRGLQTPGRPGHEDVFAPERYWSLSTPERTS